MSGGVWLGEWVGTDGENGNDVPGDDKNIELTLKGGDKDSTRSLFPTCIVSRTFVRVGHDGRLEVMWYRLSLMLVGRSEAA